MRDNWRGPCFRLACVLRMAFFLGISARQSCAGPRCDGSKQLVDFRALRGSLTAQIMRTYLQKTGKIGRPGSMLIRRRPWSFGRRPDRD